MLVFGTGNGYGWYLVIDIGGLLQLQVHSADESVYSMYSRDAWTVINMAAAF